MNFRPSLLMFTAVAAGAAVLANGVSAAGPITSPQETRLGASIKQDVASRDQDVARRNRALELREQAARAAEQRAANLQGQERPAQLEARDANEERYSELARIYQAMRPNKAAAVFEQLEIDVQVAVARRMRERSTGLIMASMAPQRAAVLTMAMARMPQTLPQGRPRTLKP